MYPITDRFKRAVKRSHTVSTFVEVLDQNLARLAVLPVHQGNVQVDGTNAVRRNATVTVADYTGDLTPSEATDLLHPIASNYMRLWRGIQYAPNDSEEVSQGIFEIFDVDIQDNGDHITAQVRGFDFAKRVQRARLHRNYVVPAGSRFDDAIKDLINFSVPGTLFSFADTGDMYTPDLVFGASGDQVGGDPWKYAQEMATAIGHELFFDIQGYCVLRPIPTTQNAPVDWTYDEGANAMIMNLDKSIRKDNTFNRVIATGENSGADNPVRGDAWDDDPNSPTYYDGPYGKVPTFFRSSYIRTQVQAQTVAEARLRQVKGAQSNLRINAIPNPAHEAGDIIAISRERAKVDTTFVLDKFNINLSAQQSMNASAREVGNYASE